ncbi:MAG: HEAT repeat domain-containing protein [Candidatus Hydrothermarchaeales archaeon]
MGIFDSLFKPNVEKMKAKKDVDGLIKALKDKNYSEVLDGITGEKAAEALGSIGDTRAVEPLIQVALDEDLKYVYKGVRKVAIEALIKMKDKRAIEPLIQALKSAEWDIRVRAAKALGRIGDARAIEPLIQALKDKKQKPREAAAKALIGLKPIIDDIKDEKLRLRALEALEKIKEDVARKKLEEDPESWAKMLVEKKDVEGLIKALKHKDSDVRRKAAEALGEIGDSRAVEPLIQALKTKWDPEDALRALRKFRTKKAKEAVKAYEREHKEKFEKLENAEHTNSSFAVECKKCGRACMALGRPLGSDTIPIWTPDIARRAARYCPKCNIVVCGACSGVPSSLTYTATSVMTCPRCGGFVELAAACHVRKTKAR